MKTDNEKIEAFYVSLGGKPSLKEDIWFYESDWNMIMPVVEKIESLGFKFTIHNDAAIVERTWNREFKQGYYLSSIGDTKILAVFGVVIQFISWYNNTSQTLKK